jgi:ABC-type thiamine transport system ATPase subunit
MTNNLFQNGIVPTKEAREIFEKIQNNLIDIYREYCDEKQYSVIEISHIIFDVVKSLETAAIISNTNIRQEIEKLKKKEI